MVFRNLIQVTYFESFELSGYAFAIATSFGPAYAFFSRARTSASRWSTTCCRKRAAPGSMSPRSCANRG